MHFFAFIFNIILAHKVIKMRKTLLTVSFISTALFLTACESFPTTASKKSAQNFSDLQNRTWIATQFGNTEIPSSPTARNIPSLQFNEANRLSGADGCNRIMGTYQSRDDKLEFAQLASTKMACIDDNGVPQQFNEALSKVKRYQVFNKTLKLLDQHGNVLIQFSSPVLPR